LAKDFDRQNNFFFNGETNISYKTANIRYFSTGAMAKIGSQKFIGKRVLFDKYIGLGFRVNHKGVNILEGGALVKMALLLFWRLSIEVSVGH